VLTHTRILYNTRNLLWAWTGRNIRARYQQSVLGWFWAIIQPAAQVAIFSVIFTYFVPVDTGDIPYPVFSYVAIVPWTLLASSLTDMTDSLVGNMGLVTKIYFPREVLPIAAMLARLMDFGIAAGLLVILMIIFRMPVFLPGLLFLPVILGIQFLLILGLGLACAGLNVFFRDVRSLLALGLQIWFYASPIIYPVTMVPEELRTLYYLNPMAGVIEGYRDVLLNGKLPSSYLPISAAAALIIFLLGSWFFKRVEFQFADVV
jgi:lipopolysaccharide transport system permease protein